jgi:hypothetical protein
MTFQITTLNGQTRTLGIQHLLGLLGDAINDEIVIGGDAYRISTAIETGSGATAVDWVLTPLRVDQPGQVRFAIPQAISDPESAFFTINNVDYLHGIHFHFEAQELIWHDAFALDVTDELYLKYPLNV